MQLGWQKRNTKLSCCIMLLSHALGRRYAKKGRATLAKGVVWRAFKGQIFFTRRSKVTIRLYYFEGKFCKEKNVVRKKNLGYTRCSKLSATKTTWFVVIVTQISMMWARIWVNESGGGHIFGQKKPKLWIIICNFCSHVGQDVASSFLRWEIFPKHTFCLGPLFAIALVAGLVGEIFLRRNSCFVVFEGKKEVLATFGL